MTIMTEIVVKTIELALREREKREIKPDILINATYATIIEMGELCGVEMSLEGKNAIKNGIANGFFTIDVEKHHYDNSRDDEIEIICKFIGDEINKIGV